MPLRRDTSETRRKLRRDAERIVNGATDLYGRDLPHLDRREERLLDAARDLLNVPHDKRVGSAPHSTARPPAIGPCETQSNVIAFPAPR